MTALLPTRWTFSLSTNLIHLQVDTEVRQVAMESAEEDETEVLKSPHAKNKKTPNVCFCICRPICPLHCIKNPLFRCDAPSGSSTTVIQSQIQETERAKWKIFVISKNVQDCARMCKIVQDLWQRQSENTTQNWTPSALGRFHLCDLIVVSKFTFWHVRKGTYFFIIIIW